MTDFSLPSNKSINGRAYINPSKYNNYSALSTKVLETLFDYFDSDFNDKDAYGLKSGTQASPGVSCPTPNRSIYPHSDNKELYSPTTCHTPIIPVSKYHSDEPIKSLNLQPDRVTNIHKHTTPFLSKLKSESSSPILSSSVLEYTTPHGTYLINKQAPKKEIWVSSPITGPSKFCLKTNNLFYSEKGDEIIEFIKNEVQKH
ncbi:Frataxin [Cucumispora dikerogammari]|nr:Frataxin [Cucumispora dikerogammari]